MISLLIPTKDEEHNLPGCLDSVRWCDDVHIYDSGSTDRTAEIARSAGATVTQRPNQGRTEIFGGDEAAHKNWALQHIPFRYPWVLHIDADERVMPTLLKAVQAAVATPGDAVAFEIQRRDFFLGQWLKHVQVTPFYLRLFRPDRMRFERFINPVSVPNGPTRKIDGFLDHYPFSKGITYWVERHNAYSTLEARQIAINRQQNATFDWKKAFFAKQFVERRFHQKELFYRIPGRPLLKFAFLYFAKRGFLDGGAGLTYAALQSIYEYMIVLKSRELTANVSQAATRPESQAGLKMNARNAS